MGKLKMRPWRNLVGAALPGALITIFALLVQPPVAHSITDPWATPDNYASAIPGGAAAWECKKGCAAWVNEDGTPIIPDAQTCANLGAAYDNTQAYDSATGATGAAASPTPMASMSATDSETYIACKMQNTQALQYCQAYSLGKKAAKSQPIVLTLDIAAAALCLTACMGVAMPGGGQVALAACEVAGVAAAIGQTVAIVNLNKTFGEYTNGRKMESILTGLAGAAALGGAGAQIGGAFAPGGGTGNDYKSAGTGTQGSGYKTNVTETKTTEQYKLADGSISSECGVDAVSCAKLDDKVEQVDTGETDSANPEKKGEAQKMACVSAATFGAMAAIRGISWGIIEANKAKACKDAENLINGGATEGYDTESSSGLVSGGASTWNSTGSGSAGGGTGGTTTTTDTTSETTDTTTTTDECTDGLTSCDDSGQASAAIDGQLLTRSGLDKAAAQLMAGKDLSGLLRTARTQGTGAAIAGLAQSLCAPASAAQQLAAIAGTIENNRAAFMGSVPQTSYAASASGMGGGSRGGSGGFGGLFGGGGGVGGPNLSGMIAQFGGARDPASGTDIWHTGTDQNIFQIVSTKIQSVSGRVKK